MKEDGYLKLESISRRCQMKGHTFAHLNICTFVHLHTHAFAALHICTFAHNTYLYTHICTFTHLHIYTFAHNTHICSAIEDTHQCNNDHALDSNCSLRLRANCGKWKKVSEERSNNFISGGCSLGNIFGFAQTAHFPCLKLQQKYKYKYKHKYKKKYNLLSGKVWILVSKVWRARGTRQKVQGWKSKRK